MSNVLVRGYYGAGNFGDDVLALVAVRSVATFVDAARITVDAPDGSYLPQLFGHSLRTVPPGSEPRAEVLVLGGGGLFYDFRGGSATARAIEPLLGLVGARAAGAAADLLAALRGRRSKRWSRHNLAYGIGIGPYAPGSMNRIHAASILSHFEGIAVRDAGSVATLRDWGLGDRAARFTDIAFLRRLWLPNDLGAASTSAGRRIGIVVRDWKHPPNGNSYLEPLMDAARRLRADGFAPRFIAFDRAADSALLAQLPSDMEQLVWNPVAGTYSDFCRALRDHELIISARAHGAILGAGLGVPSICIAIEPKLEAVAAMLESSAGVWRAPFDAAALVEIVGQTLSRGDDARRRVQEDIERNGQLAEAGLAWLGTHLVRT